MTAVCKICKKTVTSLLVGMDRQKLEEDMAITLLNHMGQDHKPYMASLVELTKVFSGFIVMNRFTIADEGMEDEKENMRDKLAERVMQDSPEEEDFEDEDQDEPEELKREREEVEQRENELNSSIVDESRKRGEPANATSGEVRRRKKVDSVDNKDIESQVEKPV